MNTIYFAIECDVNMIFLCWGKVGEEDPTPWPPFMLTYDPIKKETELKVMEKEKYIQN